MSAVRGWAEVLLWSILALVIACTGNALRPSPLSNDSYQYLSVAENLRSGSGLTTSLVHFDSERSHGVLPAPMTTFAPAYAVAVSAVSAGTKVSTETAARWVSIFSYALTALCLSAALIRLGTPFEIRQCAMVLLLCNAAVFAFASAAMSEMLFTATLTGAALAFIGAETAKSPRTALLLTITGNLLAGLTYWIRYAGVLIIASIVIYAAIRLLLDRSRARWTAFACTAIPIGCFVVVAARNVAATGGWRGGNELSVHNSAIRVAVEYVKAQLHLLTGNHAIRFGLPEALLIAGAVSLLVLGVRNVSRRLRESPVESAPSALVVAALIIVYSAGMFYAGLTTVISFGTRMFVPILPLCLVGIAAAAAWLTRSDLRRRQNLYVRTALACLCLGYATTNARDLITPPQVAPHEAPSAYYESPGTQHESIRDWIDANVRTTDVLVAADGQATGHLLGRPVLSLVGPEFSGVRWNCEAIGRETTRFSAEYILLYKRSTSADVQSLADSSPFVSASLDSPTACGFGVAVENPYIRVLKRLSTPFNVTQQTSPRVRATGLY